MVARAELALALPMLATAVLVVGQIQSQVIRLVLELSIRATMAGQALKVETSL